MNKEWKREYMDFQITIKQKEREAAEKAVAEATPKIIADEKKRIIIRMLEDGSLSEEQIMAITGASAEELESRKHAVSKN